MFAVLSPPAPQALPPQIPSAIPAAPKHLCLLVLLTFSFFPSSNGLPTDSRADPAFQTKEQTVWPFAWATTQSWAFLYTTAPNCWRFSHWKLRQKALCLTNRSLRQRKQSHRNNPTKDFYRQLEQREIWESWLITLKYAAPFFSPITEYFWSVDQISCLGFTFL